MMKKQIRMIGLDLDGTVFNEAKRITPRTREALIQAIRQGVTVLPATGRPECGLPEEFLQIPGVRYALTSNGARILELPSGQEVYLQLIPWEETLQVISFIRQWKNCVWEVYFGGKIYAEADEYSFLKPLGMSQGFVEYIRRTRILERGLTERIQRERIPMEKIHMIFMDTDERDRKLQILQERFPTLSVSCATTFNLEINSAKADKGTGLLELGRLLGIEKEEIMACGDAENDWDMLKKAGFPVAMANADAETKKLAAYVTRSNEEDGVAWAIEQFVLKPSQRTE